MKKILTVSVLAMMAVTAANAEIASKGYVDVAENGTYVTTTNTAGQNIAALDAQVKANYDRLPADNKTVAQAISSAIEGVTGTANSALQSVTANNGAGVVTNIAKDGTAVTMTKAKVSGSDIADDAGIAATQLASGVQTTLTNAAADHTTIGGYGDIVTHNAAEFETAGTAAGLVGTLPAGSSTVVDYVDSVAGTADTALQSVTANNGAGVVTSIAANGTAIEMTKAKVSGSDIADNAGIAATQLASGVQTSLTAADNALPAATYNSQVGTVSAANMGTTASTVVGAISETHDLAAAAIPAPSGNCTDCVLHFNGTTYSWEDIARGSGEL